MSYMMQNTSKNDVRFPFSRQPAHCLIIDLTSNFSKEALEHMCDGISNFFTVVCNMSSGPNRVPFFCMLTITPYTEVIFSAQRLTKSSCSKIEAALSEMRKMINDGNVQKIAKVDFKSLEHAMRDATSQFQKIKQIAGSLTKLELTLISCHSVDSMRKKIAEALSKINLSDILRVNVLCLIAGTDMNSDLDFLIKSQEVYDEDPLAEEKMLDLTGILDLYGVDCDPLSIEAVMRGWLIDRGIEREHLHICFNTPGQENGLIIKCVVRERVIDIAELPFRETFEITTNGNLSSQQQTACKTAPKPTSAIPITVLRVVKRVASTSLCESILFGRPLVVSSSNCWQMEWDELELNQNYFNALCRSLIDTKQAIIAENVTPVQSRRSNCQEKRPFGLFVIMASEKLGSMLLKSISSQELLLESSVFPHTQWEGISQEAKDKVDIAMQCLESEQQFNPLLSKCHLVSALKATLKDQASHRNIAINKQFALHQSAAYGSNRNQQSSSINTSLSYQSQAEKPTTGKAARFVAPRQEQVPATCRPTKFDKSRGDVPNITLSTKQRLNKSVSFPDFQNF